MGTLYSQASFKNSRISSRKPTTQALTLHFDLLVGAGNISLFPADPTRTYVTLFNTSLTEELRYAYSDLGPAMATDGFLLKPLMAADLENPGEIWVRNMGVAAITLDCDYGQG